MLSERFLRLPDVIRAVGVSRSTIYKLIEAGRFPASFRIAPRCAVWRETEVSAWLESRSRHNQPSSAPIPNRSRS